MLGLILAAVKRQAKSNQWQRNEGQYIPSPYNWLNESRWQDEVKPAAPVGADQGRAYKNKKPNAFHNFPRRQWDYDELERLERELQNRRALERARA